MIASHAGQNRTRQLTSQSLSSVMTCVNLHSRIPHHPHSKLITTASTSTINPDRYSALCDLSAVLSGLDLTPIASIPSQSSVATKFISLSLGSLRSLNPWVIAAWAGRTALLEPRRLRRHALGLAAF